MPDQAVFIYIDDVDIALMRHNIFQFREAALDFGKPHIVGEAKIAKMLFVPQCVMLAFTIEVEMKYISLIAKGRFVRTHNLERLFNDLPSDLLNTILKSKSGEYIKTNIAKFADYFVDVRYDFQKGHTLGNEALNFFTSIEPVLYKVTKLYNS